MSKYIEEYSNITDEELEKISSDLESQIIKHENIICDLKYRKNLIDEEKRERFEIKRLKIVDEYFGKLSVILTENEFENVTCRIDRKVYDSGKMIVKDIEEVYETISTYKSKFKNLDLSMMDMSNNHTDDNPPKHFYHIRFKINNYDNIFVGIQPNCKHISMFNSMFPRDDIDEKTLKIINKHSDFDFLDEQEKEKLVYDLLCNQGCVSINNNILKIVQRIKYVKELIPDCKLEGVNVNFKNFIENFEVYVI